MISVQEAFQRILEIRRDWGTEKVPLENSLGRVLATPIVADRDFPPFDRVSMDGIAIAHEAFASGQRHFLRKGIQAAGMPALRLSDPKGCLEAMTGATCPIGTDTVVRYEDLEWEGDAAVVQLERLKAGANVHPRGFDRKAGDLLVAPPRRIGPAEVGLAATVGQTALEVTALPDITVIATGDELVDIRLQPAPHQIRRSNTWQIVTALEEAGYPARGMHFHDDRDEIRQRLANCLQTEHVLILTGGVSRGKHDYLPELLQELGVQLHFHKVAQRPGKPMWFGAMTEGPVIFALPGNPVSAFMCTLRYVLPWLSHCQGLSDSPHGQACLADAFAFEKKLTYFLQVKLRWDAEEGRLMADPVKGKGSGDLANLADSDAFLELPAEIDHFPEGSCYPFYAWHR